MNIVVLTPDRVGSTLLQRLLTIYMYFHDFDRPVINLHELTNGLMKYWSPVFNREVLGKPNDWGYFQTLPEIRTLLKDCDHYKTSRLAHYHLRRREDSQIDQLDFYQYINDEFFIISARRDNLFEHVLSWCIYVASRKLNVYTAVEKIDTFQSLYRDGITVERENFEKYLNDYQQYIAWVDRHFRVDSYFEYDRHMGDIEKYILNLDIFRKHPKPLTWQDKFGINFSDWNRCHYMISDVSGIGAQLAAPDQLQIGHETVQEINFAVASNKKDIYSNLALADQMHLVNHGIQYKKSSDAIQELVDHKVLVTGVPIKLQTLLEKRMMILNFDECVTWYNNWVQEHGLGKPFGIDDEEMIKELSRYHAQNLLANA